MSVVLCPDTRKLSPEAARNIWWEVSVGKAITKPIMRLAGWEALCAAVTGKVFAFPLPEANCLVELDRTFKTESEALAFILQSVRPQLPVQRLEGPAAMAERQRVWRVDGK